MEHPGACQANEQNVELRVAGRDDHDEETLEEPSAQLLT